MGRSGISLARSASWHGKISRFVEDDVEDLPLEDSIRRYGSVKWSGPSYPRVVATHRRRLPPAKVGGAWSSSRTDGMPLCICTEVEGPYSSVGVTENERSVLVARQVAESAELTFCVGHRLSVRFGRSLCRLADNQSCTWGYNFLDDWFFRQAFMKPYHSAFVLMYGEKP